MDYLANLARIWDEADERDIGVAIASYPKYQRITTEIAAKYGFSPTVGAAVFAALSPNNDYWGNLRNTDDLLAAAAAGKSLDDFRVSTYGNNKRKAWAIAHGEDPDKLIVALKTSNFFHNIADPSDPRYVTIDGHMHNIWFNRRVPIQSKNPEVRVVKVDHKLYHVIADGVKAFAKAKDLLPCEMQGVLWQTWRRIHAIRTPAQQELWDRDFIEARLGFVCS